MTPATYTELAAANARLLQRLDDAERALRACNATLYAERARLTRLRAAAERVVAAETSMRLAVDAARDALREPS